MSLDYMFIIPVMLVGSVIGLVAYQALQENHPGAKSNGDYKEVQAIIDNRVKWATVAASICGGLGLAACVISG